MTDQPTPLDLELAVVLGDLEPAAFAPQLGETDEAHDEHELEPSGFISVGAVLDAIEAQPSGLAFMSGETRSVDRDNDDEVADALANYLDGSGVVGAVRGAYAPSAMHAIYPKVDRVLPSMEVSGIYARKPGYHNARAALPGSDYSVKLSDDRAGDGWAAAAIDLKFNDRDMKLVTGRLMAACQKGDPRVRIVREFFGTLNGRTVTGWNRVQTPGSSRRVGYVSSDPSHLWHVHISILRRHVNDKAAMLALADVMLGIPSVVKHLEPYVVDPAKVSTTLTANGLRGKSDKELKPGTVIRNGVALRKDTAAGGKVRRWLETDDDRLISLDYLVTKAELDKRAPAKPAASKYLPVHYVTVASADVVNRETEKVVRKLKRGHSIRKGIGTKQVGGKQWLLDENGTRIRLDQLSTKKPSAEGKA